MAALWTGVVSGASPFPIRATSSRVITFFAETGRSWTYHSKFARLSRHGENRCFDSRS
jgi:hypothetical protein